MRHKRFVLNLTEEQSQELDEFIDKYHKEGELFLFVSQMNTGLGRLRDENTADFIYITSDDKSDQEGLDRIMLLTNNILKTSIKMKG